MWYRVMTKGQTCEGSGFLDVLTNAECNAAASMLGWTDTAVCSTCPTSNGNFPNGCFTMGTRSARGDASLFTNINTPEVSNPSSLSEIRMICRCEVPEGSS